MTPSDQKMCDMKHRTIDETIATINRRLFRIETAMWTVAISTIGILVTTVLTRISFAGSIW